MTSIAPSGLLPVQIPSDGTLPPGAAFTMLRANLRADFIFYRRSRLLLAFGLAFLLLTGLSMMPTLFSNSRLDRFGVLQEIFQTLTLFTKVLSGGLGLFIASSHLRNRSLKMVFTKPCSPGLWLLAAFLSAAIVALLLHAGVLLTLTGLSLIWHLPVRMGLLFLALNSFVTSLIVIAYTLLLGTLVHPALAVTFIVIFSADTFFSLQKWALSVIAAGNAHAGIRALEKLFQTLYLALPVYGPFAEKFRGAESAYRTAATDWKYLLYSFGYALVFSAFCYFVALLALQKKRHI